MKKIIVLIFLPVAFLWAGELPQIIVEGKVTSFDKTSVRLLNDGRTTTVPRDSIPGRFKVKPGNYVYAVVDAKKFHNKDAKKEAVKKKPVSAKK